MRTSNRTTVLSSLFRNMLEFVTDTFSLLKYNQFNTIMLIVRSIQGNLFFFNFSLTLYKPSNAHR